TPPMAPAGFGDRVEGLHAVEAAVAAQRVEELWVEASRAHQPDFAALAALAEEHGARVHFVKDVTDRAETSSPQGVVARSRPILSIGVDELLDVPRAALMVLDHVVDPHNLGAVARSSHAAGLTGLIVAGRRAAPLSAVAFKAAAGALERLPVAVVNSIADTLSRLNKGGVWTVGLAAGSTTRLFGLALLSEPVALVVGEEGGGLSRLVAERCEVIASIPVASGVESLNVSVAAALAAYEVMRVRASG
ncbi:MAG: RNA methyltransferase, partial [Acidimicrobiia bacterium]